MRNVDVGNLKQKRKKSRFFEIPHIFFKPKNIKIIPRYRYKDLYDFKYNIKYTFRV